VSDLQCARTGRTLERVDIEALVVPIKAFIIERFFECALLCIIWGDYFVRNILILEVPSKKYNRLDFLLVLKMWSTLPIQIQVLNSQMNSFLCSSARHHLRQQNSMQWCPT
jgi:hypothetical protein